MEIRKLYTMTRGEDRRAWKSDFFEVSQKLVMNVTEIVKHCQVTERRPGTLIFQKRLLSELNTVDYSFLLTLEKVSGFLLQQR